MGFWQVAQMVYRRDVHRKSSQSAHGASGRISERRTKGPSTQYLRILVQKTIPLTAFGTRVLKCWVLGGMSGQPVTHHYGLLYTNNGLLWGIVAYDFQLLFRLGASFGYQPYCFWGLY